MHLSNFTEQDIESLIDQFFGKDQQFRSIEDAYQQLAQFMCYYFSVSSGQSDIVLSRVYHSFDFSLLPDSLQQTAKEVWGDDGKEGNKFIALMGTYGANPEWRQRTNSNGHKVILLSHESLTKIPMVARLLQQIGFDLGTLLGKNETGIQYDGISGTFGVFYVSPALDSPYIPAQDFVSRYNIKSVLGTGVMLPQGDIAVYIGFSQVEVSNEVAANLASLMSLFWQRAFPLLEQRGMFSEA